MSKFSKKILSRDSKKIYMADWLAYKPYNSPINGYDQEYVNLCNKIYNEMCDFVEMNIVDGERDEARLAKFLAISLVSYLEDFSNEIGLWKAFTDENMRNMGKPLSIVLLSQKYSTQDINKEDIQYLLWHYLVLAGDKQDIADPESEYMIATAAFIYQVFDAALASDSVPTTDFYDDFLTITPKTAFFDIKTKFNWVTFSSFLCGREFKRAYQERCADIAEDFKGGAYGNNPELLNQLLYSAISPFFYTQNSSMAALPVREILASIAHTDDDIRHKLREMRYYARAYGYVHQRLDADNVEIQIIGSSHRLAFNTNSMPPASRKIIQPKTAHLLNLVKWGEEYWLSGSCLTIGGASEANLAMKNLREDISLLQSQSALFSTAERLKISENQQQYELSFNAYFGKNIVFTNSENDNDKQQRIFMKWQNASIALDKNGKPDNSKLLDAAYWQKCADTPELHKFRKGLPEISDNYFAMIPKEGIFISDFEDLTQIPTITQQNRPLNTEEGGLLFACIMYLPPLLSSYLFEKYDFSRLGFSPKSTPEQCVNLRDSLPALQRFYQPDAFNIYLSTQTLHDKAVFETPFV